MENFIGGDEIEMKLTLAMGAYGTNIVLAS